MICLLQTATADTVHTRIFACVTRHFSWAEPGDEARLVLRHLPSFPKLGIQKVEESWEGSGSLMVV